MSSWPFSVARAPEPFLSAVHLLACRLIARVRKPLGVAWSQASSARLYVSRPPALADGRRQLLWFAVTRHPTAEWLAQQIVY
jgi:hypothetical protein